MDIIPSGQTLGARVEEIDLADPLSDGDFRTLLRALGQHGVLCFPHQTLDTTSFRRLRPPLRRTGDQCRQRLPRAGPPRDHDPVQLCKENGKQIGAERRRPGLAHRHVLQPGHRAREHPARAAVPNAKRQAARRDTVPQHACRVRRTARCAEAQAGRPHCDARLRQILGHDAARPGSTRKPLTEEQRAKKPPVSQPIFRVHPITGRIVLYANLGYTMFIDGMDRLQSGEDPGLTCFATRSAPIISTRTTGRWATY